MSLAQTAQPSATSMINWRYILGRLPMPMLALAASYGVYMFGLLFMPWYFSAISASAFEATYIGLAVAQLRTDEERLRARNISVGAVVVSILYNAAAAYFHRNPDVLVGMPWFAELALAFLHAAPLATLAYLVAALLLHSDESATETALESRNVAQPHAKIVIINRAIPHPNRRRQLQAPQPSAAMPRATASAERVDGWIGMKNSGMSYAAISKSLDGDPTRQYISSQCNARLAQLAEMEAENATS